MKDNKTKRKYTKTITIDFEDYANEQTGDIDLPVINIIVFLKKKNWFKRMILWIKNLF